MSINRVALLVLIPLLFINIYSILDGVNWLRDISLGLVYLALIIGYFKQIDYSNFNLLAFFGLSLLAIIFNFFKQQFDLYWLIMFFQMVSYFFLSREAFKHTKREAANRIMVFFFVVLISSNIYFLYTHLREMESHIQGLVEFSYFTLYYINLIVLGIVGLMYYLNSYSRKSVFFIILVMAIIFSDVFRDMASFYMSVKGVLVCESILRFFGVILAFRFFMLPEKKLRLINLV
ncbi:hypothetical protein [Christiangramia salexigens]|uniref:Uncharacterized protein n=1 Tax=Christiangramia salexigens TaxID=1913577 RepID=A0A1L3J1H0_9FLAO|nr:hypothetical protein [Christiangramia salexigens]APG58982.1 hypothetical protein LPB144_00550 [Christiangramia salexigens]